MNDTLITFETAKLAKEKGFGIKPKEFYIQCYTYYDLNKKLYSEEDCCYKTIGKSAEYSWTSSVNPDTIKASIQGMDNSLDEFILAPTQSLLQKWLRNVKDIYVNVILGSYSTKQKVVKEFRVIVFSWETGEFHFNFFTYEEALEKGLQEALKLISNG